jgi:thiamine-monophosphate kinase
VDLVGGDTTLGPLNLCVTILGEAPAGQALRRSGARAGDAIYVSGTLGDAALAVAHQQRRIVLAPDELARCEQALLWPRPRVELGQRLRGIASAAIDISDGLTGDLGHILEASGRGASVELAAVPRSAILDNLLACDDRALGLECLLAGGDDYELCFTAPARVAAEIGALAEELDLALTQIGRIEDGSGLVVRDETGRALEKLPAAFDHFRD